MSDFRSTGRAFAVEPYGLRAARLLLPIVLVLSLVSCATDRSHRPAPPTPDTATLEQQTYAKINQYRLSKGRRALVWSDVIAGQARQHSQMMARGKARFGHSGFNDRTAAIGQSVPWSRAGENVAINRTAADVVDRWVKSRSHRANIEGDFDLTGIGAATARDGSVYFTQIFIKAK
jgi:uncharacterized protein YkwD